jgi:hypothetical protein
MLRAYLYLGGSGLIWMVEGFLFSYFLQFAAWQVALTACIYLALFLLAARFLLEALSRRAEDGSAGSDLATWRLVSLAPMATVIMGSFASLPLLLIVLALGRIG